MTLIPDGITNGLPEQAHRRLTRAEAHKLAFLARYRVESTRKGYQCALNQWFGFLSEYYVEGAI